MSKKNPSVSVDLVINDGKVDPAASNQAFNVVMAKYISEHETEQTTIASAVSSVLDEQKGTAIKMPTLAGFATMRLNAQKENYDSLHERVLQYVRDNSQGKKLPDGSFEHPTSLFVIGKGKYGGVRRRSDIPVAPPEGTASPESPESDSESDSE